VSVSKCFRHKWLCW